MADDDAVRSVEEGEGPDPATDPGLARLLEKLREEYNFDFREYKAASLARRIRTRMSQVHVDSFDAYVRYLEGHPDEHVALFNTVLINVTGFFRDAEGWTTLAEDIIPRLVREAGNTGAIRIWSAGCSSGEEPYSLAILLADHLGARADHYQIKIYGTDVDEDALAAARHALYRVDQLKDMPDRWLEQYFMRDGQLWRLRRDLRRWCIFGAHDLTQASPLSHIDLLVCRNVLIYFSGGLQERLLSRFHYAIRDGGYLFLGRSESLLARSALFRPLHPKWRIFQRLPSDVRASGVLLDGAPAHAPSAARTDPASGAVRGQRAFEALPSAAIVLDTADTIVTWNAAAEALFETPAANAVGRRFQDVDISYRVEGLRARLEDVKARQASSRIEGISFTRRSGAPVHANVAIVPLFEMNRVIGVLVNVEDATEHARLRDQMTRIAEQHATAIEELQSTNEELETTNEELQSTNEELETTNEELQSTNEELETTVAELQAANAELAALNAELEERGAELARVDSYHRAVVDGLEQAVFVLDRLGVVRTWSAAAARLFGLPGDQAVGREFSRLPLGELLRAVRPALERIVTSDSPETVERLQYTGPGGVDVAASLRILPIKDAAGAVIGSVAVASPAEARTTP